MVTWTRPELLWGLAGAAVPLVAHLAHRRRARERPWPSLWLLRAVARGVRRRARLRDLALLALRAALVAAFVLALAGPRRAPRSSADEAAGAAGPGSAAIVLDASFGMRLRELGISRFERAQRLARQIVEASSPERRLALVVASERSDLLVAPTLDQRRLVRSIGAVGPGWRRSDLTAAVSAALRALAAAPPPRTVYVLTDLAAAAWPAAPAERLTGARIEVLDLCAAAEPNGAVLELSTPAGRVVAGVPFPVEGLVLRRPGRPSRVELVVDGRVAAEQRVPASEERESRVSFPRVALPEPGAHRLEVRLADADRLEQDNVFRLGLTARGAPRLAVCEARRRAPGEVPASRALALACGRAAAFDAVRPEALAAALARPPGRARALPDACVLVGPPRLAREAWDRVAAFVEEGGALAVFADESGDLQGLAAHAHAPAAPYGGLLPGRPAGPVRARPARAWRVTDAEHPLFAPLSTDRGELDEVRFTGLLELAPGPEGSRARALASFVGPDGSASSVAVAEKRYGAGRVVLFAFSPRLAPDGWTDLAARPCFVVLARALAAHLAPAPAMDGVRGTAGAPLELPAGIEVAAVRPGPEREFFARGLALLRHTAPGFWGVRDADGNEHEIGVNVEAEASRLAPVEPEALAALLSGADVRVRSAAGLAGEGALDGARAYGRGQPLAPWAWALAALLLAAEALAALRAARGGGAA